MSLTNGVTSIREARVLPHWGPLAVPAAARRLDTVRTDRYGPSAQFGSTMFLRYYVELDLPTEQVEAALLESPATWLPALADGAVERAEPLFAEVGVGPNGLRVARRVVVRLGQPVKFPSKLSLPMSWEPGGRLLPKLDAELEVASLGKARTQLAISGRYEPPLGTVGRTVDRLALHRVAEATIKDFLDRAAVALTLRSQEIERNGHGAPPVGTRP